MHNWNWSYTLSSSAIALAIVSSLATPSAQAQTNSTTSTSAIKVGETRSQTLQRERNDSVARIHAHQINGKNAATVYVRGIPVVTYVEDDTVKPDVQKAQELNVSSPESSNQDGRTKGKGSEKINTDAKSSSLTVASVDNPETLLSSPNPIERATAAAALINKFNREGIDASQITPIWRDGKYLIKLGDRTMLKFDKNALFPDSLKNETADIIESTNLLRRLLGGAAPISDVIGAPKPEPVAIVTPALNNRIVGVMSGMASWYGPGFDGNYSASGEIFRASDLTAAHPSLPFGTMVRVINMDNGQSVVVRINDRGPYAHGRIIDISTAAANVIGLISSGVAPVRLEVLSR
ncbi:MAG: septal ring lytic transglycosylase RlpA family protein [Pseudanabaenaceae cyanobacterium bins.39]|nr:septal ring lytic transglycosylase RlpA family protein [Pseudanabaenaceae cyanobacterium bins.39]